MMTAKQWARVKDAAVHGLRRGAWYPVVAEGSSDIIVLNVSTRNVPVPRDLLDLSDEKPSRWSVVQWKPEERGAQRASEVGFGLTYVVCPSCRARARIDATEPELMICPECAGEFEIEWTSRC
ncbi:MAG: hypothetical protein PVH40_07755 [Gemmatimonadales bacterium]|jgi:hypothetical protein